MFWERDSTPINQNINTIPQKTQKLKKKNRKHMQRIIDPQRTSTYERPFTHEGNYLVSFLFCHVKYNKNGKSIISLNSFLYFSLLWLHRKDAMVIKQYRGPLTAVPIVSLTVLPKCTSFYR